MITTAGILAQAGLLSGDPDKEKKKRSLQFSTLRPDSINISGLQRFFKREPTDWRAGDETVSLYSFGFFGIAAIHVANQRAAELDPNTEVSQIPIASTIPELMSSMLEMSVLKGSAELMNAIQTKRYTRWFNNYMRAVVSVPLPNVLTALNKTDEEFIKDVRTDSTKEIFVNAVRERNVFFDDTELPLRRDFLGRPLRRTPEGSSPLAYQLYDITKSSVIPRDKYVREISDVFENTQDLEAIPSVPQRFFQSRGERVELNNAEYDEYQGFIGKERRRLIGELLKSSKYNNAENEVKVAVLNKIYDNGRDLGKRKFLIKQRGK